MDSSSDDELFAALPIESDDEASAYLLSVRAQSASLKSGSVRYQSTAFAKEDEPEQVTPPISNEAKELTLKEFESFRVQVSKVPKSTEWTKDKWQRDLVELRKEPTMELIGSMYQPQLYTFIEWFSDLLDESEIDMYYSQVLYCALSLLELPLLPSVAAELFRIAKVLDRDRETPYKKVNLVLIEYYFGQRLHW
mmetsp:Transcript_25699/g.45041  ORF Transcript_25699/g.45041 Transcript_25699/m.45041 type:complete len:194 (+) Transcript_25699:1209-1790(+)